MQLKKYGCELTSGETSEMKVLIPQNKLDIAGFAVGIVQKNKTIPKENIKKGDVIIGLASSGIHSNGFSLIRKLFEENKLSQKEFETCLVPTKVYYNEVFELCQKNLIKSAANITGGGILHNLARALSGKEFSVDFAKIPKQPIFEKLFQLCGEESYEVFNMGVGFCVISAPENVNAILSLLSSHNPFIFGEVE